MKKNDIFRTLAMLAACLVVAVNVSAQQVVYKWTDEDGVVHFGESPPPGVQAERIVTSAPPTAPAAPAPAQAAPQAPAADVPAAQPQANMPERAEVTPTSEMSLAELEARCEAEREKLIAPLRQAEIERCQAQPRTDPQACVRMNATFGDPVRTANGTMTPRMFHDIPPCLEAHNARSRRDR